MQPIVDHVWEGKTLNCPLLLDHSFTTYERFGLESVGHFVLIDPEGILRKGDLSTLSERLNPTTPEK